MKICYTPVTSMRTRHIYKYLLILVKKRGSSLETWSNDVQRRKENILTDRDLSKIVSPIEFVFDIELDSASISRRLCTRSHR